MTKIAALPSVVPVLAGALAVLLGAACGGSSSETPPPMPPDLDRPLAAASASAEPLAPRDPRRFAIGSDPEGPIPPPVHTWRTDEDGQRRHDRLPDAL